MAGEGEVVVEKAHCINMKIDQGGNNKEEENDCPIDQVRLTVAATDDPSLPVLTFRTWFLGLISCAMVAFINQFFGYRQNSLWITAVTAQIVTHPLGKLMAKVLPTWEWTVPFTNWKLSLNPGPFNRKEHALIYIFASCAASGVYATSIITMVKAFYHRDLNPYAAWFLVQTTQLLGYGWAGLYRKVLVESPYMWWPENMIAISLFGTLHDTADKRGKGELSRLQFFLVVFVCSFAYYVFPGYLALSISYISFVCLIWKKSVLAQQLGSGISGLGFGSFTLDWSTIITFTGNPISTPAFAIINTMIGFFLIVWVMTPLNYFYNVYDAKKFPFISQYTYDKTGNRYDVNRVLNSTTFTMDMNQYHGYSKLYLSTFFAFAYGLSFATLSATISHVALFHGKTIWSLWRKAKSKLHEQSDVHTRLMKKNYDSVPNWWFLVILAVVFALSMWTLEGFGKQLQLPWWGLIMACAIALFFTLPVGIIEATTGNQIGLNVFTELVIGYVYPGRPLANVCFKTYGYISMSQALSFLNDFKLGHYMKIPPKSMFIVQLVGTIVSSLVSFQTSWWLLTSVPNICNRDKLPRGSPWTCPGDSTFYSASIIWGMIGPMRMFTNKGIYGNMNWWFLGGALAPIPAFLLSRKYPQKKWIQLINMPLIIGATANMPPARSLNYIMYGVVGIFFNVYLYRVHRGWWARYAYVLGAALTVGTAFMGVLLFFALPSGPEWWGNEDDDYCPLATCPTAPGVVVEGCPIF